MTEQFSPHDSGKGSAHEPDRRSNRLIDETSPYLLQHAHNPVDWYPWSAEALQRAHDEDRPILLSVGYSACHWCHVMERESFENVATAALMNEHFVNIKVDREERPDIDAIYMAAVQAMTGQGGWPMTVFLTPEGVPFFGGTYFPPEDRHGLPGFPRVLMSIAQAYRDQRDAIAQNVEAFRQNVGQGLALANGDDLHVAILGQAFRSLIGQVDRQHGGLGGAPKFPQASIWEFLLRTHHRTGDRDSLALVEQTLQAMANGGIYDQLGGGFHRYSTDAEWLAPHFEKMLYDNAQLASLYLHAFQVTGNPFYRRIVEETLDYVRREMTASHGGFYAAQDADSEGVEGKFFVWTSAEVAAALRKDDAAPFMLYYDVTPQGNWEGHTILRVVQDEQTVARHLNTTVTDLQDALERGRAALLTTREGRIKPGRDEKVLTNWNGLMLRAFAEAARVLNRSDYREVAETNAAFLLAELCQPARDSGGELRLWHTLKDGRARFNGYLEDYAFLADGLLFLYEATFDLRWFVAAGELTDTMLAHFWDSAGGGFFSTSDDHETLVDRPKDLLDNATPSGNSVACDVLLRLSALSGDERYATPAERVLRGLGHIMSDHPAAFPRLLSVADFLLAAPREIALIGHPDAPDMAVLIQTIYARYQPNKVVALARTADDPAVQQIPLLAGRSALNDQATAYVCEHFACRAPVTSPSELAALLIAR